MLTTHTIYQVFKKGILYCPLFLKSYTLLISFVVKNIALKSKGLLLLYTYQQA